MLPLKPLRGALARLAPIGIDMSPVSAPRIRLILRDPQGLQQRVELQTPCLLTTTTHGRQDLATAVSARMPPPAWGFVPLHACPYGVAFRFLSQPHDHLPLPWLP
jgi:hypothetical protein